MHRAAAWLGHAAALSLLAACGGDTPEPAADTTTAAAATPDSAVAVALRDSALVTLATLVDSPSRATFDSVVVFQPPHDGKRWPALAVCGRIGGLPGRRTPARFVYQSKWTVFVEEAANQATFAELWARSCAGQTLTHLQARAVNSPRVGAPGGDTSPHAVRLPAAPGAVVPG